MPISVSTQIQTLKPDGCSLALKKEGSDKKNLSAPWRKVTLHDEDTVHKEQPEMMTQRGQEFTFPQEGHKRPFLPWERRSQCFDDIREASKISAAREVQS